MEKKILASCNDQQKRNSRKMNFYAASDATSDATSDAQTPKRDTTDRECDDAKRRQKQTSCDAKSPELCSSEPVGVLRRCSTKRYALVRQSKVIGEKRQQNLTQIPCQERENEG